MKLRKPVGNDVKYGAWFTGFCIFFQTCYTAMTTTVWIEGAVLALICLVMEWRELRKSR